MTNHAKRTKEMYPVGSRVRLIKMDMEFRMRPGLIGTVQGVDGIGDIMVQWENGSTLKLIPEVDKFEKVKED